ncbi:hypothetical protein I8752_29180 [Nostocaceae cyanobacterium CENA369]|uniref:Uncharacterized protein n=1 Tax=Dendronalium phyllosphericum CENA369 TaxID=1725256 RepID=A0A8J7IBD6_9NOST|nr:hypothetical protein [Dendronalium phyllosphericum]MBH8576983.1 hypothetical protein [Dendronalium phyllosphericum CENA369]
MKFDATAAGFLLSSVCAASGWVVWWQNKIKFDKEIAARDAADSATKAYAAKRDFEHLRNNQKDISTGITLGFDEMERRFDDLDRDVLDIKTQLTILNATEHK